MDPRQAMSEQEKSLALDPSFALAWNNLAGSDPLLGHDEKAVGDLKAAIATAPSLAVFKPPVAIIMSAILVPVMAEILEHD